MIIAKAPCVLQYKIKRPAYGVDPDLCTGCKHCLKVGCIALSLVAEGDDLPKVEIDAVQCTGCGVCAQMCRFDAIGAGQRRRTARPSGRGTKHRDHR